MNIKTLAFPAILIIVILSLFAYAINQRDKYIETKSTLDGYVSINESLIKQLEQSSMQLKLLDETLKDWVQKKDKELELAKDDLENANKLIEVKYDKNANNCRLDDALVSLLNNTCGRAKGGDCKSP